MVKDPVCGMEIDPLSANMALNARWACCVEN